MVTKTDIIVYTSGKQEIVQGNMTLNTVNNSHTFNFDSDKLMLSICLKDIVDIKDFHDLLIGREKKNILHCTLNTGEKEYKGLRKVLLIDDKVTVSLGGMRLEFQPEKKKELLSIIKEIKKKNGV
jgi:hypothetical protein